VQCVSCGVVDAKEGPSRSNTLAYARGADSVAVARTNAPLLSGMPAERVAGFSTIRSQYLTYRYTIRNSA